MKRITGTILAVVCLVFCSYAQAQTVLNPSETAGTGISFTAYTSSNFATDSTVQVGKSFSVGWGSWNVFIGFLEFDISTLLAQGVTQSNFTATLSNVIAAWDSGSGNLLIDLYDMADNSEDNLITDADINNTVGTAISSTSHTFDGVSVASFGGTDVTDALWRDLFGPGLARRRRDLFSFRLPRLPKTTGSGLARGTALDRRF